MIRETTRLCSKHRLNYDQTKYVVEQVRRRIGLAAPDAPDPARSNAWIGPRCSSSSIMPTATAADTGS